MLYIVMFPDTERGTVSPVASFSTRRHAERFIYHYHRLMGNVAVAETPYVESINRCKLGDRLFTQFCFRVYIEQTDATKMKVKLTEKAEPLVDSYSAGRKDGVYVWHGWAETPDVARTKARLAALSSWRNDG